jgi:hypothetical protein
VTSTLSSGWASTYRKALSKNLQTHGESQFAEASGGLLPAQEGGLPLLTEMTKVDVLSETQRYRLHKKRAEAVRSGPLL